MRMFKFDIHVVSLFQANTNSFIKFLKFLEWTTLNTCLSLNSTWSNIIVKFSILKFRKIKLAWNIKYNLGGAFIVLISTIGQNVSLIKEITPIYLHLVSYWISTNRGELSLSCQSKNIHYYLFLWKFNQYLSCFMLWIVYVNRCY